VTSVKVLIAGRSGRMGREIEGVVAEYGLEVIGGLGRSSGTLEKWLQGSAKPDVVIDFSLPVATSEIASTCASKGIPLVSGVTGISESDRRELEKAALKIPVLYSANMSVGIQMLAKALDALKGAEGFDFSIEDIHHRLKKDRPSGTAILLNEELKSRTGRGAEEIVSLRGGGVIGTHRVFALSDSETLTFEHNALNRTVFARGACRAARWVFGRSPGFHGLRDIL
jgi:4-hydroxy-tetrahydrodipicolinate reductase